MTGPSSSAVRRSRRAVLCLMRSSLSEELGNRPSLPIIGVAQNDSFRAAVLADLQPRVGSEGIEPRAELAALQPTHETIQLILIELGRTLLLLVERFGHGDGRTPGAG